MTKNNKEQEKVPPTIQNLKILVCDDESQIQEFLWNLLSEEGHIIDFAKDGEEVFKLLGNIKYDLLILDVNIPKMNGYKVSEKICRNIKNRPKILIFTARDIESEKLQFVCSDADAILQKGTTSIDAILKIIHELFPEKKHDLAKETTVPLQNTASLSTRILDHNKSFQLEHNKDLKYCFDKISKVERLIAGKLKTNEDFIRYMLAEKQTTEKKFSELKNLQLKFKAIKKWLYILSAISLFAIIKSFV